MPVHIAGRIVVLTAILFAAAASAAPSPAEEWHVVDRSGAASSPVPGAVLLFTYHGTAVGLGHSTSVCDDAVLLRTDANGAFRWPDSRWNRYAQVVAYKPGHAYPRRDDMDEKRREIVLNATDDHELLVRHFRYVWGGVACTNIGDRRAPIREFVSISLPELRRIATDKGDLELLRRLEWMLRDVGEARERAVPAPRFESPPGG